MALRIFYNSHLSFHLAQWGEAIQPGTVDARCMIVHACECRHDKIKQCILRGKERYVSKLIARIFVAWPCNLGTT